MKKKPAFLLAACIICSIVITGFSVTDSDAKIKNRKKSLIYPKIQKESKHNSPDAENSDGLQRYFSHDSFQKVVSYYEKIGTRHIGWPSCDSTKLADGQTYREAYFIIDSAQVFAESKLWVKVQRPYILKTVINKTEDNQVTAIQETDSTVTAIFINGMDPDEECASCGNRKEKK